MTLDDVLADAHRRLAEGVSDRASPFRNVTLGSVDASGAPCVRTVVLRGFDPARSLLTVHTDLRAAKTVQVRANPLVALHAWDDAAQTQLRIGGRAALHAADARSEAEWGRLHGGSRATYAVADAPGTPITDPAAVGRVPDEAAFAHFAVIDVSVFSLEWLLLAREGHRRARFTFGGAGRGAGGDAGTATWLVP